MNDDKRKSERFSEFLPATVLLRDAADRLLAGPFPGTIVDICREGACLLMSQVESGAWHVYHSPRQDSNICLQLVIDRPGQALPLTIAARPVWLNTFEHDEFRERVMGLAFTSLDSPDTDPKTTKERP